MLTAIQYPITHASNETAPEPQVLLARAAIKLSQKARHAASKIALAHKICSTTKKASSCLEKQSKQESLKQCISHPTSISCFWVESWLQAQTCDDTSSSSGDKNLVQSKVLDCDQLTICSFTCKDDDDLSTFTESTARSYTYF